MRNFNELMAFIGNGSGGSVAGCGDNDPLALDPNDPQFAAKLQRLKVRALLEMVPHILSGLQAATNPVLANTAFTCSTTTPIPQRISRIDFPPSTAPFFTLSNITTGLCTIIVPGSNISAEALIPNGRNPPLEVGVWNAGTPLTAAGNNIDGDSHRVDMTVWGIALASEWGQLCQCC